MPRVSIITALYNHRPYIAQAIESVLNQTFNDWEHLIWDDGSSDGSLAIAKRYAEKHPGKIRVFTHPGGANHGQENTRNAALAESKGELLCLLDSDDYYEPRKLELLVPCFKDPRVGLAYGRFRVLLESLGQVVPSGIEKEPQGRVLEPLLRENFIGASATMFRKSCLERGARFDAAFKTIGEYPLWIKIARDWEFAHVAEAVAVWRDHGSNLGTKLEIRGKAELVELFQRLLNDAEYGEHNETIGRALAKKRYDYASVLYGALKLTASRQQCLMIMGDKRASAWLRVKAAVLLALASMGSRAGKKLAEAKRAIWELRNPQSKLARINRERKSTRSSLK